MEVLKKIFENLNNDMVYGYDYTNVRLPFFRIVLSADNKYIYWQNSGSSAEMNTLKDLEWIFHNIFDITPEEFTQRFECVTQHEAVVRFDGVVNENIH